MMFSSRIASCFCAFSITLMPVSGIGAAELPQAGDAYFNAGQKELWQRLAATPNTGRAKNIILFVGDGMSIPTIAAARIMAGQKRGGDGESHQLAMESRLPYTGLSKTYSDDFQVPDSAATATALVSGVKTRSGVLGLNSKAPRGDCSGQNGQAVTSIFEQAEGEGLATGVVTTTRITHATPAATYAKMADRNWEHDTKLPAEAVENGCRDIARQLVEWNAGDGFEVILGGGRGNFLPQDVTDPEYADKTGLRGDGRNLIAEWKKRYNDASYVWEKAAFDAIDPKTTGRLMGLFEPSHMQYEVDRANDAAGEPSLAEMTGKAIDILQQNDDGFVLMVEGGRIDHGHHAGNAARALNDTLAFDDAVSTALDKTDSNDTLIIVTADHSHTMTINGYPARNTPILGLAGKGDDGKPFTTLSYANGPGAVKTGAREDLSQVDTLDADYIQQALVPRDSETHGGDDVAIFARGPWAHLVRGTMEQNTIYQIMRFAMTAAGS